MEHRSWLPWVAIEISTLLQNRGKGLIDDLRPQNKQVRNFEKFNK